MSGGYIPGIFADLAGPLRGLQTIPATTEMLTVDNFGQVASATIPSSASVKPYLTVADMLAESGPVTQDYVHVYEQNFSYEVVDAPTSSTVANANGQDLLPLPSPDGSYNIDQFGAVGNAGNGNTDDSPALLKAMARESYGQATGIGSTIYDSGPTINFSDKAYYFAQTFHLKKSYRFVGQGSGLQSDSRTELHWAPDTHGFVVHRYNTDGSGSTVEIVDPTTTAADGTQFIGLEFVGGGLAADGSGNRYHGVWAKCRIHVDRCMFRNWSGNGMQIVASDNIGTAPELRGNANQFRILNSSFLTNGLSGLFIDGGDANAGVGRHLNFFTNGRWGLQESSFLGNYWDSCHCIYNGVATAGDNGGTKSSMVTFGGNQYRAVFDATEQELVDTEPGTDPTVWDLMGVGGASAFVLTWVPGQPVGTYFPGGDYVFESAANYSTMIGSYEEGGSALSQVNGNTLILGGNLTRTVRASRGNNVYAGRFIVDRTESPVACQLGDASNDQVLQFQHDDDTSSGVWRLKRTGADWDWHVFNSPAFLAMRMTGENTTYREPYRIALTEFLLGTQAAHRRISRTAATPVDGDLNDIYFYDNPSSTGYIATICTTAGTGTAVYTDFGPVPIGITNGYVWTAQGDGTAVWAAQSGGGDPDQNLWETITADTGSEAAPSTTATLTVSGAGGIATSISGTTLTIDASGVSGGGSSAGDAGSIQMSDGAGGFSDSGIQVDGTETTFPGVVDIGTHQLNFGHPNYYIYRNATSVIYESAGTHILNIGTTNKVRVDNSGVLLYDKIRGNSVPLRIATLGFGVWADDSLGTEQARFKFADEVIDNTSGTRKYGCIMSVYDTAQRDVARGFANGTSGYLAIKTPTSAAADGELNNSEVTFFDDSGSLKAKAKDSGGTVTTYTIGAGAPSVGSAGTVQLSDGVGGFTDSDIVNIAGFTVIASPLLADEFFTITGTSSTTTGVSRGQFTTEAIDNTHATRKYALVINAYDTIRREAARAYATGTAAYFALKTPTATPADSTLKNGELTAWDSSGVPTFKFKNSAGTTTTYLVGGGVNNVTKTSPAIVPGNIVVWDSNGVIKQDDNLFYNPTGSTLAVGSDNGTSAFQCGSQVVIEDNPRGTRTLKNINVIDATARSAVQNVITALPNATSWQGHTFTLTGNLTRVGAHAVTLTSTATTSLTLPTSGTLLSTTTLVRKVPILLVDRNTDLTTQTIKVYFPLGMTVSKIWIGCFTAPTGSVIDVDVKPSGTTMFSTRVTIDATELTSETAATAAVISDSNIDEYESVDIQIVAVGSTTPGKGLQIIFEGTAT